VVILYSCVRNGEYLLTSWYSCSDWCVPKIRNVSGA